ncbi:MAG: Na(+)-translocating NADH-quinone reductase subunit A [Bacteroidales bacterium]|nr:Na(+)-translocating NADH-quinone reductase subunit A [Bacteroidales bacterium]
MAKIKIRKGKDIRLAGMPSKHLECFEPTSCAIKPTDFIGVLPKLHVEEGDTVKVGSVLFHDKNNENIVFTSPVSGTVKAIVRGEKRAILEVIVESDGKNEAIDFGAANSSELSRNELIDKMLQSGVWPMLRQRPFATIANPNDRPKHIFISMFDTAPLAPDNDYIISEMSQETSLQMGVNVLSKLTDGNVYININTSSTTCRDAINRISTMESIDGHANNIVVIEFEGPHPAGNVGTQINAISPINKGEIVWYCYPQDVITIGNLFLTGKYDSTRIIATTGSAVKDPHYYKTKIGADITPILNIDENSRVISGNVLTGTNITNDGYLCFHDTQVTVIPEGNEYKLFGWLLPITKRFTNTNTKGDTRPYIMTGEFERVFPFDIYPMQLIKACLIKDIDQMEELGIYEVDAEDFALCEVIDPSKTSIQQIIRKGLEFIRKETN